MLKRQLIIFFYCLFILAVLPSIASADENGDDLTDIPLESLMSLKVTSVSKKVQPINNAAAAIFVITQDDIRHSGATSIPEVLRMAPGIQVARIDSNKWAISSRGFNGRFANKLLVLMDGRSIYTPFFIGVYWEVQDTLLEDIERIEIIRGPGAALWGTNAVNGVINIITKSANATTGALVSVGGGSYENEFVATRFAKQLTDNNAIRLYAKQFERGSFVNSDGSAANDSWKMTRGGFRLDSRLTNRDSMTIQGDYYSGVLNETYQLYQLPTLLNPVYSYQVNHSSNVSGGNIISRWQRTLGENDALSLQLYYDHTERDMLVSPQQFNTFDIEFQHRVEFAKIHDFVWGGGYRYNQYQTINTPTLWFDNRFITNHQFSAFIHDDITVIPDKLSLVLGSRIEQSNSAGIEFQPNARLIWRPTDHHSLWTAISRATRATTKGEQEIHYNYRTIPPFTGSNTNALPLRLEIVGNKNFRSEELTSYEIGYRAELPIQVTVDLAFYYNDYNKMRVITPAAPYMEPSSNAPTNLVQPYYLSNDMHGHSFGAELATEWNPNSLWILQTSYSFERLIMNLDGNSSDFINKGNAEGDTPRHQLSIRSGFKLTHNLNLDLWLRGLTKLDSIDGSSIPGYVTMDARVAWSPYRNWEITLTGQNLFEPRHKEFVPEYINTLPSEVPRSIYGKVTWKY